MRRKNPRSSDSIRRASCFVVTAKPKASEASPRPEIPWSGWIRTISQTVCSVARMGSNSMAVTRRRGAAHNFSARGHRAEARTARRLLFTGAGARLAAEKFQVARDGFDAAEEIRQVEFLIGRVQVVVGQAEAHHDARNPESLIEDADDRNGPARADVNRFLAEDLLHGFGGGVDEGVVGVGERWGPGVQHLIFRGNAFRTGGFDGGFQLIGGFVDALVPDQAGADLGDGARGNHGFGAFADETAANAVHLQRRPRPEAFKERNLGFADQLAGAHFLFGEFLFVEREPRPRFALFGAGRNHAVIKAGDFDVAVAIFQRT